MRTPSQSGRIKLEDDAVVYALPDGEIWRVRIADLRVVGEFTNCDGPYGDDYFFVFLTHDQRFEASFYADGRDEALAELSHRLHHTLVPGLCNSASLASRVLWPPRFEGHPLFHMVPVKGSGIIGKLRQRVFPSVHISFTEEVRREFELCR